MDNSELIATLREKLDQYFNEVNAKFREVGLRIQALSKHLAQTNNPHRVTKAQVGLAKVRNYPVATKEQAIDGTSNSVYMTPQRTTQTLQAMEDELIAAFEQATVDLNK